MSNDSNDHKHKRFQDDAGRHYHFGIGIFESEDEREHDNERPGFERLGVVSPVPGKTVAVMDVWECRDGGGAPHVSVLVTIDTNGDTTLSIEQEGVPAIYMSLPYYGKVEEPEPTPVTPLRSV